MTEKFGNRRIIKKTSVFAIPQAFRFPGSVGLALSPVISIDNMFVTAKAEADRPEGLCVRNTVKCPISYCGGSSALPCKFRENLKSWHNNSNGYVKNMK